MFFWIIAVTIIAVDAMIVFFALRIKTKRLSEHGFLGSRPMEVVWTLLPIFLLAATILFFFNERIQEMP